MECLQTLLAFRGLVGIGIGGGGPPPRPALWPLASAGGCDLHAKHSMHAGRMPPQQAGRPQRGGRCAAHVAFTLAMEGMPTSHRVVMMVAVQGFWTVGTVAEVGPPAQPCTSTCLHTTLAQVQTLPCFLTQPGPAQPVTLTRATWNWRGHRCQPGAGGSCSALACDHWTPSS